MFIRKKIIPVWLCIHDACFWLVTIMAKTTSGRWSVTVSYIWLFALPVQPCTASHILSFSIIIIFLPEFFHYYYNY